MARSLPARPNLDHLRSQAKKLLAQLHGGDAAAARTLITHLPEARQLSPAQVKKAGFRLADAQSAVARMTGFDSWPLLARHVQLLHALEGEWTFAALQVDGTDMAAGVFSHSKLLIDGDRFRMESVEASYEGVFNIDVEAEPMHIDIDFVEGPEAGNSSHGIFELDRDRLTICLGLVGSSRPKAFATKAGSGHALERLRRASSARPAGVEGGKGKTKRAPKHSAAKAAVVDTSGFDGKMTPLLERLQGEWAPLLLVMRGEPMNAEWLAYGNRATCGNEMKVVFGGQTMTHARMRLDENTSPIAVDYLNLSGSLRGKISLGIMEWRGDDVRFLVAAPGATRPASFPAASGTEFTADDWKKIKSLTLSEWRRRG